MIHLELQPETEAQLAAEAQLSRDLQQGLREIAEGNTLPARQVFAQLREEYDIRD